MNIFLDTNVLLDWLLDRKHTFADSATHIISAIIDGSFNGYISGGSVFTIANVLFKSGKKGNELKHIMLSILNYFNVSEQSNTTSINACHANFADLEDSFQYHIALNIPKMQYFITANLKDFESIQTEELKVIHPNEFVKLFKL